MAKLKTRFLELQGWAEGYVTLLLFLGLAILAALASVYYMEHHGHHVTGMTNRVVWGTPHIFAVFLIVAASGALNVASIGSVFNRKVYKPLAPLSGLLAVALLAGGLAALVLDLGRPDRLLVAITNNNFKSIFAWNIYLYSGFMAIVAVYLFLMMAKRMGGFSRYAGITAFTWRLILTTGTGSIFGFLASREPVYGGAIMAPTFIAMSLSYGTAVYLLVLFTIYHNTGRPLGDVIVTRLKNLLGVLVATTFYFILVGHISNMYTPEGRAVEFYFLWESDVFTNVFWFGVVLIGSVLPFLLLYHPATARSRFNMGLASAMVIVGGFSQMYMVLIGGQSYPLNLFPGYTIASVLDESQVAPYDPSLPELLLGLGGVAIALAIVSVAIKFLPFLPESLADTKVDPIHSHYNEAEAPETVVAEA